MRRCHVRRVTKQPGYSCRWCSVYRPKTSSKTVATSPTPMKMMLAKISRGCLPSWRDASELVGALGGDGGVGRGGVGAASVAEGGTSSPLVPTVAVSLSARASVGVVAVLSIADRRGEGSLSLAATGASRNFLTGSRGEADSTERAPRLIRFFGGATRAAHPSSSAAVRATTRMIPSRTSRGIANSLPGGVSQRCTLTPQRSVAHAV